MRKQPFPDRAAILLRGLAWALAAGTLAACTSDITLQNPRTGETVTCRESLQGANPWSQTDACATGYLTQGWVTTGRDPGVPLDSDYSRKIREE